jgi:ubiquinol-cytochrome c reductase iron-sulfur subunit
MKADDRPLLAFGASAAGAVGFVVAFAVDAGTTWLGVALAIALAGLGAGLVLWSAALHTGDATEPRHRLTASEPEATAQRAAVSRGTEMLGRRRLVLGAFGAAIASIAAMLVVPLRSLGRAPGGLTSTPWGPGRRLVTSDGRPVRAASIELDGVVTAYPEGDLDSGDGPLLVVRLDEASLSNRTVEGGAVGGIVAYSKICTHAGCAVGLFQADSREPKTVHRLLCPCHQSEFDPLDGAKPIAGPATRSLPQLPLAIDDEGNLAATADFPRPVGPAFWSWP